MISIALVTMPLRMFRDTILNEREGKEMKKLDLMQDPVLTRKPMYWTLLSCALEVRWCLHNKWRTNMIGGQE